MFNLGLLLEDSDPDDARHWWKRAADQGNTHAMVKLGELLRTSDPESAQGWWKRAADLGNTDALRNLELSGDDPSTA
jgi:TPR repeat protein